MALYGSFAGHWLQATSCSFLSGLEIIWNLETKKLQINFPCLSHHKNVLLHVYCRPPFSLFYRGFKYYEIYKRTNMNYIPDVYVTIQQLRWTFTAGKPLALFFQGLKWYKILNEETSNYVPTVYGTTKILPGICTACLLFLFFIGVWNNT